MIYELINPSDMMTIESEDPRVAQVVCMLLGRGKLGLDPEEGEIDMPMFAFFGAAGDEALEAWLEKEQIGDPTRFVDENREAVCVCLETIVYGSIEDRRSILETVGREGLAVWNDRHRSSMNDFATYGVSLAMALRGRVRE